MDEFMKDVRSFVKSVPLLSSRKGWFGIGVCVLILIWWYWSEKKKTIQPSNQSTSRQGAGQRPSGTTGSAATTTTTSKQKPRRKPSLVMSTRGIILNSTFGSDGQSPTLIPSALDALKRLLEDFQVYLITKVATDEEEDAVRKCLTSSGLCQQGLDMNSVLFCEKSVGKVHITRQLSPTVFVDDEMETLLPLAPHIQCLFHYSMTNPEVSVDQAKANITHVHSFDQVLTLLA
eukprot:GFYU01001915.1.p1 GENE.GFYU01001915.1~~GFYU01001915.1.p1  ORF type:complete len:265 (+),score=57.73 GFYU01001915.1:102-797(+)